MIIDLPWPPKELSPNARTHWAAKARIAKRYRSTCRILAMQAKLKAPVSGPIPIEIVFYPPDRRHRDDDNCTGAFKPGRDGVADALGVDDSRFRTAPTISDTPIKGGVVRLTFLSEGDQ
ncbi:endodeoxyribonuclease RusA [Pseudomonas sp. gcc21]|uniref:endodeoxyribonuclease RusA n=1 Tax=Pseudomonas sp. gcc21 TaxID=2726989 RepID=UPI00145293F5|nr:endodeoxyribonuclease RusA [Pseudomonas sp. gcc21]QJD58182.1 endodeoxyribonuclease RusA [Pseudomonas sp. gcc21]